MKTLLKSVLPPGVRNALRMLRCELRFARIHRRGVKRARRLQSKNGSPIQLHFGCGPHHLPGFTNIDLLDPSADLHLDLRRPVPWLDNQVQRIYSEHFVEHLRFPGDLEHFLGECKRVLCPGGLFEAGVPDAEKSLISYAKQDREYFVSERRWHPDWVRTHMDHVNYTFRQGDEHQWAFDFETLRVRLEDAGFCEVRRREWNSETDLPGWEGCLYVVATKPSMEQVK
jgi:predicted SAM-dependent methyltransferase